MKESHDQLLQMCSPVDKDFLRIQIPPVKGVKRKGPVPPVPDYWFLTGLIRYQREVQAHWEVQ